MHANAPQRRGRLSLLVPATALALAAPLATTALSSSASAATPIASIDKKVDALLAKMTLAEKFGQLEMAGPDGANGTPGPMLLKAALRRVGGSRGSRPLWREVQEVPADRPAPAPRPRRAGTLTAGAASDYHGTIAGSSSREP